MVTLQETKIHHATCFRFMLYILHTVRSNSTHVIGGDRNFPGDKSSAAAAWCVCLSMTFLDQIIIEHLRDEMAKAKHGRAVGRHGGEK